MNYQKCPICEGHGKVPQGFYGSLSPFYTGTAINLETCKTCKGAGIIDEFGLAPSWLRAEEELYK
jgi:hypothetical protein